MANDKQAMQAGAPAGDAAAPDGVNSQGDGARGSAYPNPHSGKDPDGGGFMGHGGQSDIAYHGSGALGERPVADQGNANAPTEHD